MGCAQISEILPMAATVSVPGQPSILGGFLNLRGNLIPLILLRHILRLPDAPLGEFAHVIIVKARDRFLALAVDRVLEVEHFDRSQITPLEEGHSLNDFADGHGPRSENSFALLNVERLLLVEERTRVQELAAAARLRLDEIEASRR